MDSSNYITPQPRIPNNNADSEIEWKRKALHALAIYPPGSLRLLALDSLRLEIVHQLARELHDADEIVQAYSNLRSNHHHHHDANQLSDEDNGSDGDDPFLDADPNIIGDFQRATSIDLKDEVGGDGGEQDTNGDSGNEQALLVNSPNAQSSSSFENGYRLDEKLPAEGDEEQPARNLEPKVMAALALQRETREYLPQLVSAILHSPAPLTQSTMFTRHLNPLATLRRLLITRCVMDPNLGIELCWLLEAEVGRAWKTLFEHRQQTGRRLIVVLPAERAAAIQQIGFEKRAAFDLLQDVESATAYGSVDNSDSQSNLHEHEANAWMGRGEFPNERDYVDTAGLYSTAHLPASLSAKRCSHFGDTMHLIDRLSQISLDLRSMCPSHQRKSFLVDRLEELNRRLRRRMITKGNVSLDVEDNRGPYDWPTLGDISSDSLKYSIHFPLEPTATVWPGSCSDVSSSHTHAHSPLLELKAEHGVMRVLNIVSSKCRVLASRERCPYLVHCEVVETGLEGRDARLFASGSEEVGATLQETLGIAAGRKQRISGSDRRGSFASYRIPTELSSSDSTDPRDGTVIVKGQSEANSAASLLPRGGDQGGGYYDHPTMDQSGYFPYDHVREEQLQQLHEQLQSNQQHPHYGPPQSSQPPLYPQER